jgi:hypothetical protein
MHPGELDSGCSAIQQDVTDAAELGAIILAVSLARTGHVAREKAGLFEPAIWIFWSI